MKMLLKKFSQVKKLISDILLWQLPILKQLFFNERILAMISIFEEIYPLFQKKKKWGFSALLKKDVALDVTLAQNLTNQVLHNVVVPPLGPGIDGRGHDRGAYENDPREHLKYRFVVSPLRGIKDTAPYFHNGSMLTLDEVIEHYNHPNRSIDNFLATEINERFRQTYNGPLLVDRTPYRLFAIKESVSPIIRPLGLTTAQKDNIKAFLLAL